MNARGLLCVARKNLLLLFVLLATLPVARAQNAAPPFIRPRIVDAVNQNNLITLRANTHPLARAQYDRGAVADNQPIRRMMLLLQRSPEQETALQQLLDEQQSQSSPNYHQWLTPQQFGQQFGPADTDVQTVTNWLVSQGFQVDHISAGKTIIEFSGNAGQVRNAFHTEIHQYNVYGQQHYANSADPQIPAALAPVVAGTVSMHNFGRKALHKVGALVAAPNPKGNAKPDLTLTCNSGPGTPNFTCYVVGPADFATIYNSQNLWNAGTDGTGQTIAIVGDSNINCADVTNFRNFFALPVSNPNNCTLSTSNVQVILNGPDPGLNGDEIEADLDVEWSGAVAKGAHIDFVTSEGTEASQGVDLSAEYIIDNNLAPVMSESFGDCEANLGNAGNQFYAALWQQAAAQGITAIVSSGDSGAAGCDDDNTQAVSTQGLAVSGLASTPYNVAVGGTDFNDFTSQSTFWNSSNTALTLKSAKGYIPEIPWDDSCAAASTTGCNGLSIAAGPAALNIIGGGGGQSNCEVQSNSGVCTSGYGKPSWQSGAAVTGLASSDGRRDVPDVALFAAAGSGSNSFYPICATDQGALCTDGSFIGVGGTSSSAPAFAGMMAMVNQYMVAQSQQARQGNANYVLYKLAASQVGASTSCNSSSSPNTANTTGCTFYDITQGSNSVPCVNGLGCTIRNSSSNAAAALEEVNGSNTPDGILAWQAGSGYDMSTGLGSVNAYNLVHNWPSAVGAFKSTTTTLKLCGPATNCTPATTPVSITHGQTITIAATVAQTSGSTVPTGSVALIGTGADGGIASSTLSGSGTANGTDNSFPGGSYNVTAHYTGDGTFGASDSTPAISVTVSAELSTTAVSTLAFDPNTLLGGAATSAPYGFLDIVRVDVTGNSSGLETATGGVSVTDNSSPIGGAGCCALNSEGYLEIQAGFNQIPALAIAGHSFRASYVGDASYSASGPTAALAFTVNKAATTAIVGTSSNSVATGTPVTLTATIGTDSIGAAPTGTVTFFVNNGVSNVPIPNSVNYSRIAGSFLGTPTTFGGPASVVATMNYTPATTGTYTFTAMYNTDTNYASSLLSAGAQVVAGTTFTVTSSSFTTPVSITTPGQTGNATITVSSSSGFVGAVTLTCSVVPTTLTDTPGCSFPGGATANLSVATTSVPVSLNITTTAASSALPRPAPPTRNTPISRPVVWLFSLAAIAMLFALRFARPERRRGLALLTALLVVTVMAAVSCSSSGGSGSGSGTTNPGTTAATYTVTVMAAASGLPTQTNTITVNVQ